MQPADFLADIIRPSLDRLRDTLPAASRASAECLLLAIAGQESGLAHRYQVIPLATGGAGPARGYWQFERGGGVAGVLSHPASYPLARGVCDALHIRVEQWAVWRALEGSDPLATAFARLLLWTDPAALPAPAAAAEETAWRYYLRLWRPGKPHPSAWPGHWRAAVDAVAAEAAA